MFELEAYAPCFVRTQGFADLLARMGGESCGIEEEHERLVQANAALLDIDGESMAVFKTLRDRYARRFPELASFELSAVAFARVVLALGEDDFGADVATRLAGCDLPNATVMIVSVTAATTTGRVLDAQEWAAVVETVSLLLRMDTAKTAILKFIEGRMERLAPNVTALVGVEVASRLIGAAGGIVQLSRVPAGNIQVIGSGGRRHLAGLSSASAKLHSGFISQSPLLGELPPELHVKAQRLLAAKVAIAARIDAGRESLEGDFGRQMYNEIVGKLEKLAEPPPHKMVKPLPIPDSERKKKRGGKRARKLKELYAQTEMGKQRNRLAFGETAEIEVFAGDRMEGMGMLGAATGSGGVRLPATGSVSDTRLREHLKKQAQNRLAGTGGRGGKAPATAMPSVVAHDSGEVTLAGESTRRSNAPVAAPATRYFDQSAGFRRRE